MSMTLRHMFRSAELTTLISRLGHSENYSFSLELETALATMVQQSSNLLTSQIVKNPPGNSLFHSDFDNFDKITATGSVHTAHGIMLQKVEGQHEATDLDVPSLERSKQRSLQIVFASSEIPECYMTQRRSPAYDISRWTCPSGLWDFVVAYIYIYYFVYLVSCIVPAVKKPFKPMLQIFITRFRLFKISYS